VAHHVAIDADAVGHVGGLVDQRLFRQPFGHRRQPAGLDERFRHPGRLVILGQGPELEHVLDADEVRRALGIEFRRVGRCCRLQHLGLGRHGRDAQHEGDTAQGRKFARHCLLLLEARCSCRRPGMAVPVAAEARRARHFDHPTNPR